MPCLFPPLAVFVSGLGRVNTSARWMPYHPKAERAKTMSLSCGADMYMGVDACLLVNGV